MGGNILLLAPRLNIGGAETYVFSVARGLKEAGFSVRVASGGGCLADFLQAERIAHHFVPVRLNARLAAWRLEQVVKKYQIDLIHANSAAAGIAAVKVKEKLGLPVLYTAHGVFGHNERERTLAKSDRIICVSEFVRRDARQKGFPAEKLVVGYTGIDLRRFCPQEAVRRAIRARFQFQEQDFVLALVARIANLQNKGHTDLLRLLTAYPGARKWRLLVVGKGKALLKLRYLVWRAGLGGRVHCVGHTAAVGDYLDAADVVVLPSQFETFGLALAEGMAMGKPALAYAVGGTPEVVGAGTGFLAPRGDVDALYRHADVLATDRSLRLRMGNRARAYVARHFSYGRMLEQIIGLYETCLKK